MKLFSLIVKNAFRHFWVFILLFFYSFILLFFYSFILLFFYSFILLFRWWLFISFVFNFLVGGLCLNGFCVFRFLEPI
ncbi:hypothetical protein MPG55_00655 [Helicobacter pylori]|nr:hypothetical protein [Helicobacter pylori]UOR64233.1 hypothetical protein MPG55_00655 [Helicobacter pylori]